MQQINLVPTPLVANSDEPDASSVQPDLKPALFANFGALNRLRYDYPLVLIDGENESNLLRPLSRIVDEALQSVAAPGPDGEALRQQVLRLEQRMRDYVAAGREELLSDLWRLCEAELVEESGQAQFGPLDRNLDLARKKIKIDGKVIGCGADTPDRILGHVWKAMHKSRARQFRNRVDGLLLKLNDILKSDHMKSDEAHGAGALSAAMGIDGDGSIDFSALSNVLHRVRPEDRLPKARVARIKNAMNVLQTQAFFGPGRASYAEPGGAVCYSYVFNSCSEALDAYRDRLPSVVAFTKALTIAELEVANKYVPDLHDAIFEKFDESDLTADQMALLPPAMIYLREGETESVEISRAYEALACGLPIKVLVQVDDILGPTSPEPPRNSFGAGNTRLAAMAMGLNNAFVLQTTSAHLYRMRDVLMRGMQYGGPAMFSVYSGATSTVPDVPAYILAAAASEARAFPSFTYDPSAGNDLVSRFNLGDNPQKLDAWVSHSLEFENAVGEKKRESVTFTFGDFAICDSRYRRFCHAVTRKEWSEDMVPFADWLKVPQDSSDIRKPFVWGIRNGSDLMRVIVDDKITVAARWCQDNWQRLQEFAGINNSHVEAALFEERRKREDLIRQMTASPDADAYALVPERNQAAAVTASSSEPSSNDAGGSQDVSDMPWIETARCTTCNECRQINDALFVYNENMQAQIGDPDAGTYRQLVEAAESCQVSIIHPGTPRNPDEPNIDDLIERAKPFN